MCIHIDIYIYTAYCILPIACCPFLRTYTNAASRAGERGGRHRQGTCPASATCASAAAKNTRNIPETKTKKYAKSEFRTNFDFIVFTFVLMYQNWLFGLDSDCFCAPAHISDMSI